MNGENPVTRDPFSPLLEEFERRLRADDCGIHVAPRGTVAHVFVDPSGSPLSTITIPQFRHDREQALILVWAVLWILASRDYFLEALSPSELDPVGRLATYVFPLLPNRANVARSQVLLSSLQVRDSSEQPNYAALHQQLALDGEETAAAIVIRGEIASRTPRKTEIAAALDEFILGYLSLFQ